MSRKVHRLRNLQSAHLSPTGPFTTDPKLKGKALEGIKFQGRVHKELAALSGDLLSEQWIRFKDSGSWHYCRPDSILVSWDRVVVWESKLSLRQLPKALAQLRLYRPLLASIYHRPVVGVVAFKHWTLGSADCLPMLAYPELALTTPTGLLKKAHGWNLM